MENFQVYRDIQARTGGDIYIGVVGPVRTGKSTFIRRFMELVALPQMSDTKQAEIRDQLPLSGSGKIITTAETKFIPKEAVPITLGEDQQVKIRLIDSVGFLVKGASGQTEDGKERMVKTPWFEQAIPFREAARIGTQKVIQEHSTIGIVVTTDGSFGELPRDNFPEAEEKTIQEPYIVMRKALDKVNRDIVYCVGYGAPNVWNWAPEAGGNQWRTTRDITDEWNVVTAIGTFQDVCADATAPGRNNDPDMLVVGKLGQGWGSRVHDSYLTADEQYSHISLWCLLSSPLLIGCDMANMDDFTLNLLTNNEVIAVSQDPMVAPAKKMMVENGQVWSKKLYDGSYAVGFFHVDPYFILWDQEDAEAMQMREYAFDFDLKQLGIEGKAMVRDLWRQKDLGEVNGIFRTEVPYHGVTFVKITPAK